MKILNKYKNGNAKIMLFDDGTRVIDFPDDEGLNVQYPLSMDCKITNKCPIGCPMCHERSTKDGKHGDIMNAKFIDKLHAGTEMAIGGGAVTGHPQLVEFLKKLKKIGVIPSITVNQHEYEENSKLIKQLIDEELIYGLGISYVSQYGDFWEQAFEYQNSVVHLIAGIHGKEVFDFFKNKNVKILILGYKDFGRGHELLTKCSSIIQENINWLKDNLKEYIRYYNVVSFDNLAIKQLDVKDILSESEWDVFYQGNDGTSTMYVDLVKEQFAKTSTSITRYDLLDDIEDMFKVIKEEN